MQHRRRTLLKAGLLGGAVAATGLPLAVPAAEGANRRRGLHLLVLGGTGFIGPHMVREMLRRGHDVSLFNRGRTNDRLFPDLESIRGDRGGDLAGLAGRTWDAVVDNSGYMPQHVRRSAQVLSGNVGQYVFISSVSAYAAFATPNDEDSTLAAIDTVPETFSWENYGALKVLCERGAADEFGAERLTVLRPTYICGPGDHTDRFTYWPVRCLAGGEMLWPGGSGHPLQIIDVRDLANFVVDCVERRTSGTYNTVTPKGSYSFGGLLEDSTAVNPGNKGRVDAVWVDDAFIAASGVADLLPLYHPVTGEMAHVSSVDGARARAAGLENRPVRETIRDLMSWWHTLPQERTAGARFAMTPEREAQLLAAWNAGRT